MLPKLGETLRGMYEKWRRVLRGNKFNSSKVSQKTNYLYCSELYGQTSDVRSNIQFEEL